MFNPLKFVIKILVEGEKDLRDLATSFNDVTDSAENMEVGAKKAADGLEEVSKNARGWVDVYANAPAEMDALADKWNAAQNPIKKTAEELGKAGDQADLLGTAIKGVGIVSPTAAAQLTRISSVLTTLGPGAIVAAGGLAAVAAGYVALKAAGDFANETLQDTSKATEEQIRTAEDFTQATRDLERQWEGLKSFGHKMWMSFGEDAAWATNKIISFYEAAAGKGSALTGMDLGIDWGRFTDKGGISGLSKNFEIEVKEMERIAKNSVLTSGNFISDIFGTSQSVFDIQKDLAEEQKNLNTLIAAGPDPGQSWQDYQTEISNTKTQIGELEQSIIDMTNTFITNMMLSQIMKDGKFSTEEQAIFSGWLVDIGAASNESINLVINTANTGLGKVAELEEAVATAANKAKSEVGEITTAIKDIPKDTTVYIHVVETKGGSKTESAASGGSFGVGQRVLVGDKPGGIPTAHSEIVEGLPGGGIKVYNASQTRGMRSMAGGGVAGNDLTAELMEMIKRLPDAMADAVQTKLLRNAR